MRAAFAASCLLGALCSPVAADEGGGAELRAAAGPAAITALQSLGPGQDGSIDGLGVGFNFALGLRLSPALSVGPDLALVRSGSAEHGVLSSTVFTALHLGVGATYVFVPADVFLGGSLGLARSSVEGDRLRLGVELPDNAPSDLGLGAHVSIGKHFALGERFGLGLSLSLLSSFANNPIGGQDGLRTVLAAMLGLSASVR